MRGFTDSISAQDWFSLLSSLSGTVLGGLIATLTAYVMARRSDRQTRLIAAETRREREKGLAFRLMIKLIRIGAATEAIRNQIEHSIKYYEEHIGNAMTWQKVETSAGTNDDFIYFDADELSLFVSMKEHAYLNKIVWIDGRYRELINGYGIYSQKRGSLQEQMVAAQHAAELHKVSNTTKSLITTLLKRSDENKFLGQIAELESLICDIRTRARDQHVELMNINAEYGPKMKRYFKDKNFPSPVVNPPMSQNPSRQEPK